MPIPLNADCVALLGNTSNVQVCKALKIYKIQYIKNIPVKKRTTAFCQ
jgi:hypothetical protein